MCPNSTYWMADLLLYDPKSLKRKKPSHTGYCFCGVGRNTWGQENAEEKQAQNKPRLTKYANTDLIKGEFSAKNREFSTGFLKNPEFRGFLSKITGFKGLKCALIAPIGWLISGLTGRITQFLNKPLLGSVDPGRSSGHPLRAKNPRETHNRKMEKSADAEFSFIEKSLTQLV